MSQSRRRPSSRSIHQVHPPQSTHHTTEHTTDQGHHDDCPGPVGHVSIPILIHLAHRGLKPGGCSAADPVFEALSKVIKAQVTKGVRPQIVMLAVFQAALASGKALLSMYPDFVEFLDGFDPNEPTESTVIQ